jgi:hypothetical protein
LLDNAGFASADRILPEYQHLQVGDWMPMVKKITATTAFRQRRSRPVSGSRGRNQTVHGPGS